MLLYKHMHTYMYMYMHMYTYIYIYMCVRAGVRVGAAASAAAGRRRRPYGVDGSLFGLRLRGCRFSFSSFDFSPLFRSPRRSLRLSFSPDVLINYNSINVLIMKILIKIRIVHNNTNTRGDGRRKSGGWTPIPAGSAPQHRGS